MRYVAGCLKPERQAAFGNALNFAPNVRKATAMITAEARTAMPDMENPKNVITNDGWWADQYDALQKRYTEWMLI